MHVLIDRVGNPKEKKRLVTASLACYASVFPSISTPKSCSLGSAALRLRVRAEHDDLLSPAAARV